MTLKQRIRSHANKKIAEHSQRFFKTGPGEYGHGDIFLGIRVPILRKIAKENHQASLKNITSLIQSKYHEERLCGLLILMNRYDKTQNSSEKNSLYKLYVDSFPYINNWDLVDVTTPTVVGQHLFTRNRRPLYKWAKSKHLWTRRISIMATFWFIRRGEYQDTLQLGQILLNDSHDLMHKAVGWMLREVGKKDRNILDLFLKAHYQNMPRTLLRYAIEKHPEKIRKKYLKGTI